MECDTKHLGESVYETWNNSFYSPKAAFSESCKQGELNFTAWQALGQDLGSTVQSNLSLVDTIELAKSVIDLQP